MHHNFFYGVVRERDGVRERLSLWRSVYGTPSQTEEQEAYRDGVPILGQQIEQRFILELQEHLKYCLMHGLENLDIEFFLHKNKVLDSDIVGAQMHHLSKRAPWVSCTPPMLSSPTGSSCTSQPEFVVSLATACGRRGARKKSVGSRFDAESAPLGGALS